MAGAPSSRCSRSLDRSISVKQNNMLKSYWKTAVRALLRNKTYGFINIIGLAAGTLSCLYILLYVRDQYSYDRHHQDVDDIYRVNRIDKGKDGEYNVAITAMQVGPSMKREIGRAHV